MRISDWSSDVCSSDLLAHGQLTVTGTQQRRLHGVSRAGAAQATLLTQDDGVRMLGARCPERLLLYVVAGAQPGSQPRGVIQASQPVDGHAPAGDGRGGRKSGGSGKRVSVRVYLGGG